MLHQAIEEAEQHAMSAKMAAKTAAFPSHTHTPHPHTHTHAPSQGAAIRGGSRIPVHFKHLGSNTGNHVTTDSTATARMSRGDARQLLLRHQQHRVRGAEGQVGGGGGGGETRRRKQDRVRVSRKNLYHTTTTNDSTVSPSGGARRGVGGEWGAERTASPPVPALARRMKKNAEGQRQHTQSTFTPAQNRGALSTDLDASHNRTAARTHQQTSGAAYDPSDALTASMSPVGGGGRMVTSPPETTQIRKQRGMTSVRIPQTVQPCHDDATRKNVGVAAITNHILPHFSPAIKVAEVQEKQMYPHRQQVILQELAELRRVRTEILSVCVVCLCVCLCV